MDRLISMVEFTLKQTAIKTKLISKAEKKDRIDLCIDAISDYVLKTENYANFLSQKLSLDMFIPCKLVDGVWVLLEEPKDWKNWQDVYIANNTEGKTKDRYTSQLSARWDCREYQEAKDRVLFEGFEINIVDNIDLIKTLVYKDVIHLFWFHSITKSWLPSRGLFTIEDLVKFNLEITDSAKRQLGI